MDTAQVVDGYLIVGQGNSVDYGVAHAVLSAICLRKAGILFSLRDAVTRLKDSRRRRKIRSGFPRHTGAILRAGSLKAQSEKAQKFIVLAGERKSRNRRVSTQIDKTAKKRAIRSIK